MNFINFVIFLTAFYINTGLNSLIPPPPKLLVISYDGFRYDYFNRNVTPYLNKIRRENTYADYVTPVYAVKTRTNHFSIATGLYSETHGVLENTIYDVKYGRLLTESYELYHYNKDVLPIWTINEMAGNGRRSGVMMWHGGNYEYNGILPTYFREYDQNTSFKERIHTVLSWFLHPTTPINLGVIYIQEPDFHSHILGTDAPLINRILWELDKLTEYTHNVLDKLGFTDINVVHLSDHGMINISVNNSINLKNYINPSECEYHESGQGFYIFPKPGMEEKIYQRLEPLSKTMHFNIYKKKNIPEEFHFRDNNRVGSIFLSAEVGYIFHVTYFFEKLYNISANKYAIFGVHGYDNKLIEMRAMFFAKGPSFLPECKVEPFIVTDYFPLFCELLALKCPPSNGTLRNLKKCLRHNVRHFKDFSLLYVSFMLGFIATTMLFIIKRRLARRRFLYRKINS